MDKPPKQVIIIAVLGVIIITAAAVVALAYNAIIHGGGTDGLTTIAAVGAGGLVAVLGGGRPGIPEPGVTAALAGVGDSGDLPPLPEPGGPETPISDDLDEPEPESGYLDDGSLPFSPENGPDDPSSNSGEAPKGEF